MSDYLLPSYQMIDIGGMILLVFIIISTAVRIWSGRAGFPTLRRSGHEPTARERHRRKGLAGKVASVILLDGGTSRPLRTLDRVKWSSHIMIFWGFMFTAVATVLAYFFKPEGAVLPLTSPVNMFGNSGGILLVGGCSAMFYTRFQESGSMWDLHRSDYFLLALLFTALSGFLTEDSIYSFGRGGEIVPFVYWGHMAIIVSLLATAPYTKFIHVLYKPSWILFERMESESPGSELEGREPSKEPGVD